MKISISNIGWPKNEDSRFLELVAEFGVDGIEIAPSKLYDNFKDYRLEWKTYYQKVRLLGLKICSMHSLFWNHKGKIFGNKDGVREHIEDLIDLAHELEIPRMIFGSPSVREKGDMPLDMAVASFVDFIYPISENAASKGTVILIEPLGKNETDFINTHREAIELSKRVNSRGFGLHLDAKAISSQKEDVETVIEESGDYVQHFHVNETDLGSLRNPQLPHNRMATALNKIGYSGYASVEMKTLVDYENECKEALRFVKKVYGNKRG